MIFIFFSYYVINNKTYIKYYSHIFLLWNDKLMPVYIPINLNSKF